MLPTIITPMNFTLIHDALCQHLANVRDNQIELALQSGAAETWVEQNIDFTIFPKRFRYPDIAEMPCVFLFFNEMAFPDDEQDIYENATSGILHVEYYVAGKTETTVDENNNEINVTADEVAEDRLNYLTSQIYKILCSEETNVYRATNNKIKSFKLLNWKRTETPDADNTVGTVLGAVFEFEIGFDEPTHYTRTTEIKEFYTACNINDEFINPLCKIILDSEE